MAKPAEDGVQLRKLALMERIDQLQQCADGEKDYADYCAIQAEIWKLEAELNSLEE